MWCKQTFAVIKEETVKNDMVCDNYELANQLARDTYGAEAIAVDSTQYPISIGDKYINGIFYFKDGVTIVPRTNTAEEEAAQAKAQAEQIQANLDYLAMQTNVEV